MTKKQLIEFLDCYEDDETIDEYELSRMMREQEEARQRWLEEREEEQHNSGFYAFQDLLEMYRRER